MNRWLCWIWHRWELAFSTTVWEYECSRCGKRTARRTSVGHQPVNLDWIARRKMKASPPTKDTKP